MISIIIDKWCNSGYGDKIINLNDGISPMLEKEKKPTRNFYSLTVIQSQQISPSMQRITLQSDDIAHFGSESEGGYIKLLFTDHGDTNIASISPQQRPVMRTYTIQHFNAENNSIEVDFVRHITKDLQCGFAARWAITTKVGDTISIAGPGKSQGINTAGDWFFLVADMTAIPALASQIKLLPNNAKGYVVIEVDHIDDKRELAVPEAIEIDWVVKDQTSNLTQAVISKPWIGDNASVWCACEFDTMRSLRQYFRNEKEVEKENIYISSYWKQGVSEDGHKQLKQDDAKTQ